MPSGIIQKIGFVLPIAGRWPGTLICGPSLLKICEDAHRGCRPTVVGDTAFLGDKCRGDREACNEPRRQPSDGFSSACLENEPHIGQVLEMPIASQKIGAMQFSGRVDDGVRR